MKESTKFVIAVLALAVIIAAAFFAYGYLSDKSDPDVPLANGTDDSDNENEIESESQDTGTAPDFVLYDNDGNELKLSDKFGKPIILNFWATWCGPCKTEMPAFDAAFRKYGDSIEFMMVDLTDGYRDTPDSVAAFIEQTGYIFPIYHDLEQNGALTYEVMATPTTLIIDKNGKLIQTHIGIMNENTLQKYIDILLEE